MEEDEVGLGVCEESEANSDKQANDDAMLDIMMMPYSLISERGNVPRKLSVLCLCQAIRSQNKKKQRIYSTWQKHWCCAALDQPFAAAVVWNTLEYLPVVCSYFLFHAYTKRNSVHNRMCCGCIPHPHGLRNHSTAFLPRLSHNRAICGTIPPHYYRGFISYLHYLRIHSTAFFSRFLHKPHYLRNHSTACLPRLSHKPHYL